MSEETELLVLVVTLIDAIRTHEHAVDNGANFGDADNDLYDVADDVEGQLEELAAQ